MPKMKTHKGAKRRFKITGSGMVMRAKGPKSHLRRNKPKRTKRQFDKMQPVSKTYADHMKVALPYGLK
jgi:large subunit ribosomal protein L35